MKRLVIPLIILILLIQSNTVIYAQRTSSPLGDVVDSVVDDLIEGPSGSEEADEGDEDETVIPSPSPSPTEAPVTTSPTPTPQPVITLPIRELPIVGGRNEEREDINRSNTSQVEREDDIAPTSTVSSQSVRTPASVQSSQREIVERPQVDIKEDEDDDTPVAAITKPIEPPLAIVRGAVDGDFYSQGGLSQKITFYSLLISFIFISLGALLLRREIISFFIRRGRMLPLPTHEPITIPYIGKMYK